MGIKQLSKVVADIAPGAIKQQDMKVMLALIASLSNLSHFFNTFVLYQPFDNTIYLSE